PEKAAEETQASAGHSRADASVSWRRDAAGAAAGAGAGASAAADADASVSWRRDADGAAADAAGSGGGGRSGGGGDAYSSNSIGVQFGGGMVEAMAWACVVRASGQWEGDSWPLDESPEWRAAVDCLGVMRREDVLGMLKIPTPSAGEAAAAASPAPFTSPSSHLPRLAFSPAAVRAVAMRLHLLRINPRHLSLADVAPCRVFLCEHPLPAAYTWLLVELASAVAAAAPTPYVCVFLHPPSSPPFLLFPLSPATYTWLLVELATTYTWLLVELASAVAAAPEEHRLPFLLDTLDSIQVARHPWTALQLFSLMLARLSPDRLLLPTSPTAAVFLLPHTLPPLLSQRGLAGSHLHRWQSVCAGAEGSVVADV
ncbi:unnamed protein product, partial [Closterium sp. NIES-65]